MTAFLLAFRPGAATPLPPEEALSATLPRVVAAARRTGAAALRWLVRGLVVVAVLAFAGLAVGPHVLGYRTLTMLSASMAPQIDPGDVVVVTPLPVSEVTAGMVITYQIPIGDHHVVTHRVVSVQRGADGGLTVQTKGDANAAPDPWRATLEGGTAYQVRMVVPAVGRAIQALRTPVVTQTLVYGAPALLAGWLLVAIWRPRKENEE